MRRCRLYPKHQRNLTAHRPARGRPSGRRWSASETAVVFVRLPAVVMVASSAASTDWRTVAGTTVRRRYADRSESNRHRHSDNDNHQSGPHAAESPVDAHTPPDQIYIKRTASPMGRDYAEVPRWAGSRQAARCCY